MGLLFAGCGGKGNEEQSKPQKYDVAIRLGLYEVDDKGYTVCLMQRIEFPVGTDEITLERKYSNRNFRLYIDQYNLPDHPQWSKYWLTPKGEGADTFSIT